MDEQVKRLKECLDDPEQCLHCGLRIGEQKLRKVLEGRREIHGNEKSPGPAAGEVKE